MWYIILQIAKIAMKCLVVEMAFKMHIKKHFFAHFFMQFQMRRTP